ncbi:hypothetical protein ABT124_46420 [Streptomyces sp. NPDC001982]|uniref:hypothetical protein n=1 Tax=Streptomyces sp. NPDC001982 TaxID=3154405 RepID=UPI0033227C01
MNSTVPSPAMAAICTANASSAPVLSTAHGSTLVVAPYGIAGETRAALAAAGARVTGPTGAALAALVAATATPPPAAQGALRQGDGVQQIGRRICTRI